MKPNKTLLFLFVFLVVLFFVAICVIFGNRKPLLEGHSGGSGSGSGHVTGGGEGRGGHGGHGGHGGYGGRGGAGHDGGYHRGGYSRGIGDNGCGSVAFNPFYYGYYTYYFLDDSYYLDSIVEQDYNNLGFFQTWFYRPIYRVY
jgi:hypothetical protein